MIGRQRSSIPAAACLATAFALLLAPVSCAPKKSARGTASIGSSPLGITSHDEWRKELGYKGTEVRPLLIHPVTGCPFVDVDVSGIRARFMVDTGCGQGFLLTDHASPIPHTVIRPGKQLNADGSLRGDSRIIRVDAIDVLGKRLTNVVGAYADWRMFSTEPFDGAFGLDFFLGERFTLDYLSGEIAVSASPLPDLAGRERYLVCDLLDAPENQGRILYVAGVVNGRAATLYLDTGYSHSWIDPGFSGSLPFTEGPGRYRVRRQKVPVELGGKAFLLNDLREDSIRRGPGFDPPVGVVLGSDFLSEFIVTIDIRSGKIILARAR